MTRPRTSRRPKPVVDGPAEPPPECGRCPRLCCFRQANRLRSPDWHNGPVLSHGDLDASVLVVGLAPGLKGANRTGLPFDGDFSGDLMQGILEDTGFASRGVGLQATRSVDCLITNAVRCVPPGNKPTSTEIARCRPFLAARIANLPRLRAVVALGRVAHDSTLKALGCRVSAFRFAHGARHEVGGGLALFDSFHCSRYNINTGVVTRAMIAAVFAAVRALLDRDAVSRPDDGVTRG